MAINRKVSTKPYSEHRNTKKLSKTFDEKKLKYWVPRNIYNQNLLEDFYEFFSVDALIDSQKVEVYVKNKKTLATIIDRFEFIVQLGKIRDYLRSIKTISSPKLKVITNEGHIFTQQEKIELNGIELNGIDYEIESLIQYLLLTLIDLISQNPQNPRHSLRFFEWLKENYPRDSYKEIEIQQYSDEFHKFTSLSQGFKNTLKTIDNDLKHRLVDCFMIGKVVNREIEPGGVKRWNVLDKDKKFEKIIGQLYEIRCSYTHRCSRTFLSNLPVELSLPINKGVIVALIEPEEESLEKILFDIVINLVKKDFENYHRYQEELSHFPQKSAF
jgi:hypothetical protein